MTLTSALSNILGQVGEFKRQEMYTADFQEISECGEDIQCLKPKNYDIEFKNVSFVYPNTDKEILKNINIYISHKEKIVIVGENGAGKSTFIKLLCRFYKPTSGTITLGGVDIWDIDKNEYYNLISAVFQDYVNFPFTIGENISMKEKYDDEKINNIAESVGILDLVKHSSKGLNTTLTKSFDEEGVEISGGESQKVALARAIYKDSPIIILDEPLSSLDAKAENEFYDNAFDRTKERTAIFISHRLAISSICDRIIVFDKGSLLEDGTHNELMMKKGKYYDMFNLQSKAYFSGDK